MPVPHAFDARRVSSCRRAHRKIILAGAGDQGGWLAGSLGDIPMEMHQVRYFLAVARTLNFTRAAEECNVTQPSLTRAIQKLEDEFGGLLFRRERARTHLTDLGREMLPHLERTHQAAQAAKDVAKGMGRAQIAPLAIGVARAVRAPQLDAVLGELGRALPGLQLSVESGSSADLLERALEGAIDLLLIERPLDLPDRIEEWPLYALPYLVLLDSGHPLAAQGDLSLADLDGEPWIEVAHDCADRFRRACDAAGVNPDYRHKAQDEAQLQRLIVAGLGCGIAPQGIDLADRVASRLLGDAALAGQVILATVSGRRRSPATEAFMRAARARAWPSD